MIKQASDKKSLLEVVNVSKHYHDGSVKTQILSEINLTIYQAEQLAITGISGSGKSTLLHIIGTLDKPSSGKVIMEGEDLYSQPFARQAKIRNQDLGFIYQFHHLLPEFTALENVAMPALIRGLPAQDARQAAQTLLDRVGLDHRYNHTPAEMSGGERQRTAIARALINQPKLVLADEPTGNLDAASGDTVYQLIAELGSQLGTAFVVVTHDPKLAARMDRQLQVKDGHLLGGVG